MTDDEYNAAFRQSVVADSIKQTPDASLTIPMPQRPTPVQGFWHRLLFGVQGTSRVKEIARSIPRGLANAANNIGRSTLEFGLYLDRKTGFGELTNPGFNKDYDAAGGARGFVNQNSEAAQVVPPSEMEAAYGNRSDDPLASFAESTTQFLSGMALARGLGVKNVYAQGAISDATVFDPYEPQLAELAAKAPNWTGIGLVGKLLTVTGDDGALVARIKRAAAGAVAAVLVDGLIASARLIRSSRIMGSSTASAAEKTAAQEVATQSQETIQKVADATHTAEGDHVSVRQTPDGQFTMEAQPSSPVTLGVGQNEAQRIAEFNAISNEARDLSVKVTRTPDEMARLNQLTALKQQYSDLLPEPVNGGGRAAGLTADQLEAADAREMAKLDARAKAAPQAAQEFVNAASPTFPNRGEAEAQAAVINDGLDNAQRAATGITKEQLAAHRQFADELFSAQSPDEVAARATDANFNLSYYSSQPEVMAQVEAISKQFKDAMDAAQKRPGGIPVAESIQAARDALNGIAEADAPAVVAAKLKSTEDLHAWLLASDMVMRQQARKLAQMSEVLDARPHDTVAIEQARTALQNFYDTARSVAGANSEVGRALRILQERSSSAASKPVEFAASLTPDEVRAQARMLRMAGDDPGGLEAAVTAGAKVGEMTPLRKLFTFFANGLLSGPKTAQTVLVSGSALNAFEGFVRATAGAVTGNRALYQEGADVMWGNMQYLADNIKGSLAAFRAGGSLLDPQPQGLAFGGVTGKIITVPTRVVSSAHEFVRLTAYRAMVRAKSLRLGRADGLDGAALAARVDQDLRAAIGPNGEATQAGALTYANDVGMVSPLGDGFGAGFQTFVNNNIEAKFIAPFVKISTNLFKYAWKASPALNLLSRDVREVLAKGGEEAAIIHTRSAFAAALYGYGMYKTMSGDITGRGPSDPALRKEWAATHQPYSIKIGDNWYSYAKIEPLSIPLGLMADLNVVTHELGDKNTDVSDLMYAIPTAIFYNLSSKSYTSGIAEFFNAWADNDPHAAMRWMQNMAASIVVPQGVNSLNPDPVMRDVQSMADAIMARVPGFSEKVPPRYNMFGEPMLKTPGLLNRNQIFTAKSAKPGVEDDLLAIGKGLSPLSPKLGGGFINLQDREAYDNGSHVAPYDRLMYLVRHPGNGQPPLRYAMEQLVNSYEWKQASDGTSLMPGGRRWLLAAGLKNRYEQQALRQVRLEYPTLDRAIQMTARMRGAAIMGGEQGVQQVQDLFGGISK
jgi:hypothetical protein